MRLLSRARAQKHGDAGARRRNARVRTHRAIEQLFLAPIVVRRRRRPLRFVAVTRSYCLKQ